MFEMESQASGIKQEIQDLKKDPSLMDGSRLALMMQNLGWHEKKMSSMELLHPIQDSDETDVDNLTIYLLNKNLIEILILQLDDVFEVIFFCKLRVQTQSYYKASGSTQAVRDGRQVVQAFGLSSVARPL